MCGGWILYLIGRKELTLFTKLHERVKLKVTYTNKKYQRKKLDFLV